VIVITGTVGPENASKSSTLGAQDCIAKPYNLNYLLKSIEHVLPDRSQTNLKLQIINAGDLIRSTPPGDFDVKASKQGLAQLAATGTDLQDYTVLIDPRDVKSQLSTTDIYEFASKHIKYVETFRRKTAVLARADENIDQATFFENVAQNRSFKVRALTVFEDAITRTSDISEVIHATRD